MSRFLNSEKKSEFEKSYIATVNTILLRVVGMHGFNCRDLLRNFNCLKRIRGICDLVGCSDWRHGPRCSSFLRPHKCRTRSDWSFENRSFGDTLLYYRTLLVKIVMIIKSLKGCILD